MRLKFFKQFVEIDESDKRLNQVTIRFNDWMKDSVMLESFDPKEARYINALIEEGLQTWAEETGVRTRLEEIRTELVTRCSDCSFSD